MFKNDYNSSEEKMETTLHELCATTGNSIVIHNLLQEYTINSLNII
jgi:hypothetical protein